jgi:hypothetical protein
MHKNHSEQEYYIPLETRVSLGKFQTSFLLTDVMMYVDKTRHTVLATFSLSCLRPSVANIH